MESVICCMCGDVGFSDKLFLCVHCGNRLQHSYCSNYYSEIAEPAEVCDWCRSDDRKLSSVATAHGGSSSKKTSSSSANYENGFTNRSEYNSSGAGVKNSNNRQDQVAKNVAGGGGGGGGGVPSPRTATRRYKLLKDVMC